MHNHKFLFVFFLAFFATDTNACSCLATDDIEEQLNRSAIVVAAMPISAITESSSIQRSGRDFQVKTQEVVWRVISGWKGKLKAGDEFRTKTAYANGQCGLTVKPHKALILYFSAEQPTTISLCERSAKYRRFGNEQRILSRLFQKPRSGT